VAAGQPKEHEEHRLRKMIWKRPRPVKHVFIQQPILPELLLMTESLRVHAKKVS
jgi:hypothetical protein